MAGWLNRTAGVLPSDGTNQHTIIFNADGDAPFAPTNGRLLLVIIGGAETMAWPGGWNERLQPINECELSVATLVANNTASVTITHNRTDSAANYVVYEFPTGTTWAGGAAAGAQANNAAQPNLTGLPGTPVEVFYAVAQSIVTPTGPVISAAWPGGVTENVDEFTDAGSSTNGAWLGVAYQSAVTATSATTTPTITNGRTTQTERVTFALTLPSGGGGGGDPTPAPGFGLGFFPAVDALTNHLALGFFGDSFTFGVPGPSTLEMRYATRTAALLKAAELAYGVGGARQTLNAGWILTRIYQNTPLPAQAPYGPIYRAAVIQVSINNLNQNAIIADKSIVTKALARGIRRLRAVGSYEALDPARWSYTGAWTDVATTDANTGAGVKRATANGATWTLTTPADFLGGVLRVYGVKTTGFGGVHTITVDGTAHGSIDNRTAAMTSGSEPWEYPITLTAGAHTIGGVVSSINTVENINGADFEHPTATKPIVVVLNTARSPNYPGGEHATTDADVQASNTAVAAMLAAQFPSDDRVVLINLDGLLGNSPSNFGDDQFHPNDTGTGLMATAIANAVLARLP